MNSAEKFCLKWDDFLDNVKSSFMELRNETDFTDVTLVCEEQQIEAHKVVLSSTSSFFSKMLKQNKHPHPMIYMRGVKLRDLTSVVDFMYHGEVNIYQEDINDFLTLAEEMDLKGLTGFSAQILYKSDKNLVLTP